MFAVVRGALRCLRLLGRIVVLWLAIHVALTLLAAGLNLIPRAEQTIVVSAGVVFSENRVVLSAPIVTPLLDALMYAPITLRQAVLGRHVSWWANPPLKAACAVIEMPRYSSVVLLGHGASGLLVLGNGDYLSTYFHGERKPGELIQLGCGGGERPPFSRVMLRDPTRAFEFTHEVYITSVFAVAWLLVARALVTASLQ